MTRRLIRSIPALLLACAGLALATPASAEIGGNIYQFLKAVRDKDIMKANTLLSEPGSAIIDARDGDTGEGALHVVVKRRDSAWLDYLLARGANPNVEDRDGNTPLILAAAQGFGEGVASLVSRNADLNARNRAGETALIKAVQARQDQIVRLLVTAGARLDLTDSVAGYTALDYAEQDRRAGNIRRLLKDAEETRKAQKAAATTAPAPAPAAPAPQSH